jgi:hypothetical protein
LGRIPFRPIFLTTRRRTTGQQSAFGSDQRIQTPVFGLDVWVSPSFSGLINDKLRRNSSCYRDADQGDDMDKTRDKDEQNQATGTRPVYEAPKITVMNRDDVLQAFQMTAAQISAAGCWWVSGCMGSACKAD